MVRLPEYACVFALTDDDQVVVEWTYRHAVGAVCVVLPAGMLDPGEEPEAAARRELREETGYEASEWQSLGSYVVDSNRGCGRMHAFLARGAHLASAQELDPMEQIDVGLMARAELLQMLRRGELKTLASASTAAMAFAALAE